MATSPDRLSKRLMDIGFSQELVSASLPDWWTAEEFGSNSSNTLVSLLLARRLNLDPHTLLDDNVPIGFLHTGPIKFKHMRLADGERRDALVGFARGVSRIVLSAIEDHGSITFPASPLDLRQLLMASGRPFVSFGDVLTACWSFGIPVLHLRVFPAQTKGVSAITVRIGERHAILVARDSGPEAQYMFHIAHELGHIALGHLRNTAAIVDADPRDPDNRPDELIDDHEEVAADAYAQELLTGSGQFSVVRDTLRSHRENSGSPRELADLAVSSGANLGVDPGHIVMCFAYSTGDWSLAMAASKYLPTQSSKPGSLVNKVLWQQLSQSQPDAQTLAYLEAVTSI